MTDTKTIITVTDNKNATQTYTTDGYVLIYLDKGTFKFTGNVEPSALGPILMSVIAQKNGWKVD